MLLVIFMILLWISCIFAAGSIAYSRSRNILMALVLVIAAIFFAPLALIVALLIPRKEESVQEVNIKEIYEGDVRQELQDLKDSLNAIQQRVWNLEMKIHGNIEPRVEEKLPSEVMEQQVVQQASEIPFVSKDISSIPVSDVQTASARPERPSSVEWDVGRYWLSKIGIGILVLGVALLIIYALKSMGPMWKIMIGYAAAGGLFAAGFYLEKKEGLKNFGRVLLGGGWALVYFTTFAAHHFPAARIIDDRTVNFTMLLCVCGGMIAHALKYKSETMILVALAVGYLTVLLGDVTLYAMVSCLLLGGMIVVLTYRFQWAKTLLLSVVMTYGLHLSWIIPQARGLSDGMALIFLTVYWAMFMLGAHVLEPDAKDDSKSSAAVNLANAGLYFLSSYELITRLFGPYRMEIAVIFGVVYFLLALLARRQGAQNLRMSHIICAVFLLTASVTFKFEKDPVILIWMAEVPILLFAGLYFREKVYRGLAYVLTMVVCVWGALVYGFSWGSETTMLLWGALMAAVSFAVGKYLNLLPEKDAADDFFNHVFSALSVLCVGLWMLEMYPIPGSRVPVLAIMTAACVGLGYGLKLNRFRGYAYVLMVAAAAHCAFGSIHLGNPAVEWAYLVVHAATLFLAYGIIRWGIQQRRFEPYFEEEHNVAFVLGGLLTFSIIADKMPSSWESLAYGLTGAVMMLVGAFDRQRVIRIGGFCFLGVTVFNIIFNDLANREAIWRIISFIILGLVFLGISYIYNRFQIGRSPDGKSHDPK